MAQALAHRFGGPDNIQSQRAEAAGTSALTDLQKIVRELQEQMILFKTDNAALREENAALQKQVDQLEKNSVSFREENTALKKQVDQLEKNDVSLKEQVTKLEIEVEKLQEKFYHLSLRNFLQYYLRAAVVGAQINDQGAIENHTAGQLMLEITNEKERYDKWAKSVTLPSYNQLSVLAKPIIDKGNKAVHNSKTDEMYKLIVDNFGDNPDLLVVFQKMWDGISAQRNWPNWAEMVAKHGKEKV